MDLQFLRQEAMDALQKGINENISLYAEEKEEWIDSFFLEKGTKVPLISSDISVPDIDLITAESALQDIENSIRLHTAFRNVLKPIQAADRRLWVALAHTRFYSYMVNRWPVENILNEHDTNGTVTDRYFTSRGLFRNGISRLFWIAELTYQPLLNDPYEYTRFLMGYQDLINQVEGRSLCRNKKILMSCLRTLKDAGKLSERQKRLFFERMCKLGGVQILDAMPEEMLDNLCNRALEDALKTKHIVNGSRVVLQNVISNNSIIVDIRNGKAFMGKTFFKSKPENLSRLTVGKELQLGKLRYRIVEIQ